MNLRRVLFALFIVLSVPALLWGARRHARAAEAWDLVEAAATAHERVSYRGRAAWRHTKWMFGVGIEHDAESGLTRYRWDRWGGFGKLGKGKFGKDWSYVIDGVSTRAPDPTGWCLDLDALRESYRAEDIGRTRFLDRPARMLRLEPLHAGRPSVRLTLDAATDLPLQVETFAPDGRLYRTTAFRRIEFGPVRVERERESPFRKWSGTVVPSAGIDEAAGFPVMRPAYLPDGFRLKECRVKEWVGTEAKLTYTDGITTFELTQSEVRTPAYMEARLARRIGARGAARAVERYLERRMAAIASCGEAHDGSVVRRYEKGSHRTYALRLGDLDLRLSSRSNFDGEETLKVLRSLRAR